MVKAALFSGVSHKQGYKNRAAAFPYVAGKSSLLWVYESLAATPEIEDLVVIGPRHLISEHLTPEAHIIDNNDTIYGKALAAVDYYGGGRILFAPNDIPLARPKHYSSFLGQCDFEKADFFYPVVSRSVIAPMIKYSYDRRIPYWVISKNHEHEADQVRICNLSYVDVDKIVNGNLVEKAYRASTLRKGVVQARAAWYALRHAGRRILPIAKVVFDALQCDTRYSTLEKEVSHLLGTRFSIVDSPHAELGLDIDWKDDDLPYIRELMERELEKNYSSLPLN